MKIIFAGLDGAGKTSFINSLEEKYSTLMKIKPTLGADRREFNLFGFTISNWDLGGQKSYRETYIADKDRYFTEINTLFYVFDFQDTSRDTEAFDYLTEIVQALEEMNEHPRIVILWHKFDKDIEEKPESQPRVETLEDKLANTIGDRFKFKTFKTSIFDKWSLLKAFSDGVVASSPKTLIIESQLRDFARKTFSSAVMLLDSNHLTLGSSTSSSELLDICEAVVSHAAFAEEKLTKYDIRTDSIVLTLAPGKYYAELLRDKEMVVLFVPLRVGDFSFSIVSLAKNPNTLKLLLMHAKDLATSLQDIIKTFYF
jgi:GTP-binding protein EngB required for normal cell division